MKLQVALTLMLVATFVADGVTRAMPLGTFTFRAWEALGANAVSPSPFEPLARYDSAHATGDLGNMGNHRATRVYRHEVFTTDAYGFRNAPGLAESRTVSVLLLGDSFAAGAGVADQMTLAGQLSRTFGRPTYTLAPMLPKPPSLVEHARMLGMRPGGWVLHQQTYLYDDSRAWATSPVAKPPTTPYGRFRKSFITGISPLQILANRAWKSWQDDIRFSNPFAAGVERRRLVNGDDMLFIANDTVYDAFPPETSTEIDRTVAYSRALADAAAGEGLRYLALLVPTKAAIYGPLTVPEIFPAGRAPGYLIELERRLRAAGLQVVNARDAFLPLARPAADRYQYLYWRDDSHWSPYGISVAAATVDAAMSTSVAPRIRVVAATYGANCNAPQGNATADTAGTCNGLASCTYKVDAARLGDPAVGCAKDYRVTWRCDAEEGVREAQVPPEAGLGSEVALSCGGAAPSRLEILAVTGGKTERDRIRARLVTDCAGHAACDAAAAPDGAAGTTYRVDWRCEGEMVMRQTPLAPDRRERLACP